MIKLLLKKNYLYTIKNAEGSKLFRNLFILEETDGRQVKKDILENGELSCAYFVTSILKLFNLIGEIHTTVAGTLKELQNQDKWTEVSLLDIQAGDIVFWKNQDGYGHVGFAISKTQGISNSTEKRKPKKHDLSYLGTRNPSRVFRYTF